MMTRTTPTKVGQRVRLLPDEEVPDFGFEKEIYPNSGLNLVNGQLDEFRISKIWKPFPSDPDASYFLVEVQGDERGLMAERFYIISQ